jgi:hypothetical protein
VHREGPVSENIEEGICEITSSVLLVLRAIGTLSNNRAEIFAKISGEAWSLGKSRSNQGQGTLVQPHGFV